MKATILDLRYHMNDVLKAIRRKEAVQILCHGKLVGIITPVFEESTLKIEEHPFFGMCADDQHSVEEIMNQLRGNRYDDL